jgi:hypothetical protein
MTIEWEKTTTGKCTTFSRVPEGARVTAIDDMDVIGRCGRCGKYLTLVDDYEEDGEGVYLCEPCINGISKEA